MDLDLLQSCFFNRGCDGIDLLFADSTAVTGVGVERCNGDSRTGIAGFLQRLVGQNDRLDNEINGQSACYVLQRDM